MKRFSTVGDTQRGSQSYVEKREEGDRGDQEEKRESSLARKQFPICSPQSETLRGSQSYIEKRRGKKEIEVTRRRKGGIKRRETDLGSNQFPKCTP